MLIGLALVIIPVTRSSGAYVALLGRQRNGLYAAPNHLRSPVLKQPYGRRVELRGRLHSEKLEFLLILPTLPLMQSH